MGRIRAIKPEILTDEKVGLLSNAAWRLFVSLFVLVDDLGRAPANAAQLGGQVFWGQPGTDVAAALAELEEAQLVRIYRVGGQPFVEIDAFVESDPAKPRSAWHQLINRPSGAKHPGPADADEGSVKAHEGVRDAKQARSPTLSTTNTPAEKAPRPRFDFEAAYEVYPRKQGKKRGMQWLSRNVQTEDDYQLLLSAAQRMAEGWRGASKEQLQYCPIWSTFIHQERWREEQLPMPSSSGRGKPGQGYAHVHDGERTYRGGDVDL